MIVPIFVLEVMFLDATFAVMVIAAWQENYLAFALAMLSCFQEMLRAAEKREEVEREVNGMHERRKELREEIEDVLQSIEKEKSRV